MVDVEVEFSYEAEQSDELTIKPGDIIKNVVMSEGGWWEGELNGKKGMFPDNFVKVIKNPEKETKKEENKKKDVQATKRQSVKDLANKLKGQVHEGPPVLRKKDASKKKKAKVTFSYEPENSDELQLEVGDMIEILKQEEEGWWEGILNGKQGVFPSNFVEVLEESESAENDNKVENTEEHLIKGKKVQGVGLGNIFGDGPIKLRSTAGAKKPGDRPVESPKAEKREDPAQRKIKESKPEEKAVVRYSYAAENEDELSLNEGDIITILDKEIEDSGWWKGELNGKVGVFPDNFVELIKEERSRSSYIQPGKGPLNAPAPQPKPKKPPPPSQPPVAKPLPKLPDKAPSVEQPKPEPVNKEEKPQPLQKKPVHPPPPLTKKPKSIDAISKDEKKEETKPVSDGSLNFEGVETSSDKLTHLTATRAKGPSKRPPSQEDERNGEVKEPPPVKEEKPAPQEKPHHIHAHHTAKQERNMEKEEVGGRTVPSRPAEPVRPDTSPVTASLQLAVDDLRKELLNLKNNSVSKTAFDELKSENEQLKQELESLKTMYSKRMREIMTEIDDEKKIRFSTQVEIERIRKLVAESHV